MHYEGLPEAVRTRLAARGIDAEAQTTAWLAAIRDGSYDVTPLLRRVYLKDGGPPPKRVVVPIVIPLAVVLPREDGEVR